MSPLVALPFMAIPLAIPAASWARARVRLTFAWRHGYWPDLDRPQAFNEWVQWRKLNDRDRQLARLTDKLHAKQLARERIGAEHVIPTLWHGTQLPAEPPWPMPFVVKAHHGCRQNVVVRNRADWERALRQAPVWLAASYGEWLDEWHYRCARRMLLVEPFIGPDEGLPRDYKVSVFGGVAQFVQVHLDRDVDHRWIQFDRAWRRLSNCRDAAEVEPPASLTQMLAAAERIAGARDHLRVDFYDVGGKLWFGETCLFPGSGLDRFDPVSLDRVFGRKWSEAMSGRHADLALCNQMATLSCTEVY